MNADDMLKYGHQTLMASIDAIDSQMLELEGACGVWSVKNILAHLTSFEWALLDTLRQIQGRTNTPVLDSMFEQGDAFNDLQVEERAFNSFEEQLTEYLAAYAQTTARLAEIPVEKRREKGLIAWYGDAYDLEDYIVYTVYAHKREHADKLMFSKIETVSAKHFNCL